MAEASIRTTPGRAVVAAFGPWLSFLALIVSLVLLVLVPIGFRAGWWPYGTSFAVLMTYSLYAAAAAGALALISVFWWRGMTGGARLATLAGLVVGGVLIYWPLQFYAKVWPLPIINNTPLPRIHDITTDTQDPPAFAVTLAAREAEKGGTAVYAGPDLAKQQQAGCLAGGSQQNIIVLRFRVVQIGNGDDVNPGAIADHDPFQVVRGVGGRRQLCGRRALFAQPALGTIEGGFETVLTERLEQVIDGMHLESPHSVGVVGGHENHGEIATDQFQNFEAVELGHLHVEEEQVGLALGGGLHGLEAVGALRDNLDFKMIGQHFPQQIAGQFFVIDDHYSHRSSSAGRRRSTRYVPS